MNQILRKITSDENQAPKSKKWLWAGLLIALVNPIFAGFILGLLFLSEPQFKKEGRIILIFSIVWGAISLVLIGRFQTQGILPRL